MEDDWFPPNVGGQPLQKFFEYLMEEAKKRAQQPSKITPAIFSQINSSIHSKDFDIKFVIISPSESILILN